MWQWDKTEAEAPPPMKGKYPSPAEEWECLFDRQSTEHRTEKEDTAGSWCKQHVQIGTSKMHFFAVVAVSFFLLNGLSSFSLSLCVLEAASAGMFVFLLCSYFTLLALHVLSASRFENDTERNIGSPRQGNARYITHIQKKGRCVSASVPLL
jgi:hypothetical protein